MKSVATGVRADRRAELRKAAARVRGSMPAEFRRLGADEIMDFLRGDKPASAASGPKPARSGRR